MSTQQLVDNIHLMSNPELIGLAKNRWLPTDVQLAIAEHPYRRAHEYLCENDGLHSSVRDYLWSDTCNKGYTLKTLLLTYGHYLQDPEKYEDLYERYPGAWTRSSWRITAALLGRSHYSWQPRSNSGCPTELLHRIYEDKYKPNLESLSGSRYSSYFGLSVYDLERLVSHQNADLTLAIKLSTCGVNSVQKLAFDKIVELS